MFASTSGKLSVHQSLIGTQLWENVTSGAIHVSPNISHDGRVYITTAASKLARGSAVRITAPAGQVFYLLFGGITPQGENVTTIPAGQGLYSSKAPRAGAAKGVLGLSPSNNTKLRKWSADSDSWQEFTYVSGNWTPGDPQIGVGEGFVVEAPSSYTWKNTFSIW